VFAIPSTSDERREDQSEQRGKSQFLAKCNKGKLYTERPEISIPFKAWALIREPIKW
jgi:hypothetical protein